MPQEHAERVKRIAWQVDTLIADPAVLKRFRVMLKAYARNVKADGKRSRWSSYEPGRLSLADRYALLAAIHDAVCGKQSEKIRPKSWCPDNRQRPKHALRYVALGNTTAPHFKDPAQLGAFLDQVKADLSAQLASQDAAAAEQSRADEIERADSVQADAALAVARAGQQAKSKEPPPPGDGQQPDEYRCVPMSKAEIARRLLARSKARPREAEKMMERYGLQPEGGNKYTIRLDTMRDRNMRERMEEPQPES